MWIGGHDRFKWSSKIDNQTVDFTFWEPGMPDNHLATQNCIRMQVRRPAQSGLLALNGEWDDMQCYNALFKAGICQARPLCDPRGRTTAGPQ